MNGISTFVFPRKYDKEIVDIEKVRVCAIIPTYKPGILTKRLAADILRWNPRLDLCVVDDCTPLEHEESVKVLSEIKNLSPRLTLLRTPQNALKAGALNFALSQMQLQSPRSRPRAKGARGALYDVIITLDDDVMIDPHTIQRLVAELMAHRDLGAICSQCRVLNKNKNILTRLQGLEYVSFNAIRLADDGFFQGPLVMPGMLTAFRGSALADVGAFAEKHLIEDYEMTVRLKKAGWSVRSATNVSAWTTVPETFGGLWRQRTRWSYGGLLVVLRAGSGISVLQDLFGHAVFISTGLVIGFLILGRVEGHIPMWIAYSIISLSVLQLFMWYAFQIWLLRLYREKDTIDIALRVTLIPEFIYSNITTLILIGSYFFLFYNVSKEFMRPNYFLHILSKFGNKIFGALGYTETWGAR